jgi:hypothetical protein
MLPLFKVLRGKLYMFQFGYLLTVASTVLRYLCTIHAGQYLAIQPKYTPWTHLIRHQCSDVINKINKKKVPLGLMHVGKFLPLKAAVQVSNQYEVRSTTYLGIAGKASHRGNLGTDTSKTSPLSP